MIQLEPIKASEGAKYLGDFMDELPTNCLLDKGRTGCGGTELAIECEKDMIIVMPFVSLIKNKVFQHNEEETKILGIYSAVGISKDDIQPATDKEIIEYVKNRTKRKLLVTYDSLGRLINLLFSHGIDVFNVFPALIDEWHLLFNQYVFRNRAIKGVLSLIPKFKEYTYMTATPIEEEFLLEELKDVPVQRVIWKNTVRVTVNSQPTNSPLKAVSNLAIYKVRGEILGNLHFFVNSVEFIAAVIKKAQLRPEQVRIVCSKNDRPGKGNKTNQTKLGTNYPIAETTDPVKMINFYTATCFEGSDIYDKDGRTYIVSDKNKSHTLMDISTLFVQICGRIRDSAYNKEVTHIYSETRYSGDQTLDEFIYSSKKVLDEAESLVAEVNNMSEENRKKVIKPLMKELNTKYITNIDNELVIDRNLIKVDIMNFKITKQLYQTSVYLESEYRSNNFDVNSEYPLIFPTDKLAKSSKAKVSFKDVFLEYAAIKEAQKGMIYFPSEYDRQSIIEQEKPLVKEAYDILGVERVKQINYIVTNIKRELLKVSDTSMNHKIVKCLKDAGVGEGTTILTSIIKDMLQRIYDSLEIKTTATETDIKKWFDAEKCWPKIDGISTECYKIKKLKLIY